MIGLGRAHGKREVNLGAIDERPVDADFRRDKNHERAFDPEDETKTDQK